MGEIYFEGLKELQFDIPPDAVNKGGGFELINNNRHLFPNPMKDPIIVAKNLKSRVSKQKPEDKERLADISRQNLKKAVAANTGKKRPEHGKLMAPHFRSLWATKKEEWRDALSSTFQVTSPIGEVFTTNRLEEFCKNNNLTYGPVWNSSRTGKPVTKGKSKGWLCTKI